MRAFLPPPLRPVGFGPVWASLKPVYPIFVPIKVLMALNHVSGIGYNLVVQVGAFGG